jgi:K+-transporting ATPase ATPase C chain
MLLTLRRAVIATALLWLILGLGFTFLMVGLGQLFFPSQANGSVITLNGQAVADRHVGQYFGQSLQYFWGRPSATVSLTTGKPEPYNALNSAPSNLGPTNEKLIKDIQSRVHVYLQTTPGLKTSQIPLSLVESSGSGLDPDISVQSALIQIPRVAKYTGLSSAELRHLVRSEVLPPALGIFGVSRINVVLLNLALYQRIHSQAKMN